ncbi:hypothetical protein QQS45_08525 [Alteriqipengyuania flavescens]|uniref:hypothetical protein n=1 Tax=Alteriqipengyuania flavescens TaxID=3053610 RepID=UPI0025B2A6E3|nr:hypothetical protein [Alteriqipengyuania flavescens]WJY17691.1 hypothetical protein QQW98_08520 [Alteriqipengyuania flavescens]WJY23634.1 hypothetical protein QQS45_08525 [Alteriqipengyuania flavescens]
MSGAKRGTVAITIHPYMRTGGDPVTVEVPCTVVGDMAVHRRHTVWKGEVSVGKGWTITHVATGLPAGRAMGPLDRRDALKRDCVKWAQEWQDACPDFFAALRKGDEARAKELAPEAMREAIELAGGAA